MIVARAVNDTGVILYLVLYSKETEYTKEQWQRKSSDFEMLLISKWKKNTIEKKVFQRAEFSKKVPISIPVHIDLEH